MLNKNIVILNKLYLRVNNKKQESMKTKLIKLFFTIVSVAFATGVFAQKDNNAILMTIAGEKITKSEFLDVYNKNNLKKDVIDKKSLEEYLDLYINFKLKVKEAESLGLDTTASFITELAGYRKQLAQPYLIDKEVNDNLLQEAYNRMQWDIRASHILIKVAINAAPKDTLIAYNKIMGIRNRIIKGESFAKVAVEMSEDPSAKGQAAIKNRPYIKGNEGDLGYFTALDLIYTFETAAYNTKVGEVSMPVRTDFGYHLVKVTDKKHAMGKVQVAHILVTIPANSTADDSAKYKSKIYEIYNKIKADSSFENMAKQYSDDKASASKGGVIPWFGVNRMVPEFIDAISKLKNKGNISEPMQTIYGWHIIKLIDRKGIAPLDSIKPELKAKITKDSRSDKSKEAMVSKIKKEYNFNEDKNALADFYKVVNDSISLGKWKVEKAKGLNKTMFTLGDKSYNQQDFAKYLSTQQISRTKEDSFVYVNKMYKKYIEETTINYEDSKLEAKYPEFKSLMKEYRDGILLFEHTDEKVWSKAVKDTVGLQSFYEKNKNNYMWDERLDASIYTCANAKIAKTTRNLVKKGKLTNDDILRQVNKDSQLNLKIESGKYLKKDNAIIDVITWTTGITNDINKDNSVVFVKANKIIPKEPKTLAEARGIITADYQTFLEKEWISELKKKYPVDVNREVFETIK
jgi:peptidyl-prolyl cis-trans isomerase SurA